MKDCYKWIIVLALLFAIHDGIKAQKNFIPGYIIDNSNDTIHGLINYQEWKINPKTVYFKKNENDDYVAYSFRMIKEFGANNDKYRSAVVEVEVSPLNLASLSESSELIIKKDSGFILVLAEGPKSLYGFVDENSRANYYIWYDNDYHLLIYKKYKKTSSDKNTGVIENKYYVGQLSIYLNDCPELNNTVQKTLYNERSLVALFKKYFKCLKNKPPSEQYTLADYYLKKYEAHKVDFGVLGGASLIFPHVTSSSDPQSIDHKISEADFSMSTSWITGIYAEFYLKRKNKKFAVTPEVLFSYFDTEGNYSYHKNQYSYGTYYYKLGYYFVNFGLMFRYRIPIKKFVLMMDIGITHSRYLKNISNYFSYSRYYYTSEESDEGQIHYPYYTDYGVMAGVGGAYKRFFLEIKYQTVYAPLTSHEIMIQKRVSFILGYRIF
jgi:hypothetical protein